MMVTVRRRVDRIPFAPVVAVAAGVVAAILVAAIPVALFERAVLATGLPQIFAVAQPPLGLTARLIAVVLAFACVAALIWVALIPVERWLDRDRRRRTPWRDDGYARVDFGDDGVDAPRKPIFAGNELGAPLMSEEALATLPPITRDPVLEAPVTEAELATTPLVEPEPWVPTTSPEGETSIHALIARLEAGLAKRGGGRDPDPGAGALPDEPLMLSDEWAVADEAAPAAPPRDELRDALFDLKKFAWR